MSTPYPGPRSVLVLDNARIHHSDEIEALVRGYGEQFIHSSVVVHSLELCLQAVVLNTSPHIHPIIIRLNKLFPLSSLISDDKVSPSLAPLDCIMSSIVHVTSLRRR